MDRACCTAGTCAYGRRVSRARWVAFLFYTLLRLLLFGAVWLLVQILTPWRGLLAIAVAILISGGISLFVLDRPRGQLAAGVDAFIRRINDRIDASARAEDIDVPGGDQGASHGDSEGKHDQAGLLEHADEVSADHSRPNGPDRHEGRAPADESAQKPPAR